MSSAAAAREEVARLFGRAAFGATEADLSAWTGKPYADAVNHLVDIPAPNGRGPAFDDARRQLIEQGGRGSTDVAQAQKWWLERMRTTQYPLEERMTLFWHGHFATAIRDPFPDVAMLMAQNQTMRQFSLGNFRDFVAAMTLDPAMLEWLDGTRNTIPVPNENYARELMELFTLGKYPQVYSEADVREAARALTGWTLNTGSREVRFEPKLHDPGTKTVLGTTIADQGASEYLTVIDVALKQPVAPLFIAYKLVADFGYAVASTNMLTAPDPLVSRVADTLRSTNWNIREAVRTMLLADEFRTGDAAARRELVRSPVEVLVAAAKPLEVSLDNDQIVQRLGRMGQPIFNPPNVGGWPVGPSWLSPSTVLARYDSAVQLQTMNGKTLPASSDLDAWARLFGMAPLTGATTATLRAYLAGQSSATEAVRQAGVFVLLLSCPEWLVI